MASIDEEMDKVLQEDEEMDAILLGETIVSEKMKPSWIEPAKTGLETAGLIAGGLLGAPAGPIGGVAGAGLGYAGAKAIGRLGEELLGYEKPSGRVQAGMRTGKNILTGAAMQAGGELVGPVLSKAGELGKKGIAAITGTTTGAGRRVMEKALEGSPEYVKAMRGKMTPQDVMATSKQGLQELKDIRSQEYLARFDTLKNINKDLDFKPIINKKNELMRQFNITKNRDGTLDFTRSTLDRTAWKNVEDIIERINDWGNKPGDFTPKGLDTLKRQLDDFFAPTKNSRVFVTSLRNIVKNQIVSEVPEYATMVKDYEKSTKVINEINNLLNSGKSETALNRLMDAMRLDKQFRIDFVKKLSESSGIDIEAQIAGVLTQSPYPKGQLRSMGDVILIYQAMTKFDPRLGAMVFSTSPRVMGEFLKVLGETGRTIQKQIPTIQKGFPPTVMGMGKALTEQD